jgi:hypothetical protein
MPDKGDDAEISEAMDRESGRLAVRSAAWCLFYLLGVLGSAWLVW